MKEANTLKIKNIEIEAIIRFYPCIDIIPIIEFKIERYFSSKLTLRYFKFEWLFFRLFIQVNTVL